jgi:hypothetical protein
VRLIVGLMLAVVFGAGVIVGAAFAPVHRSQCLSKPTMPCARRSCRRSASPRKG